MKTTFKIDDFFIDRFIKLPKSTPYSELSEDEKEQKFMDVLTNGLTNDFDFFPGITTKGLYYIRQNQSDDPIVKVTKNKKWYDTFRKGYANV
jgi:hypothetical protein